MGDRVTLTKTTPLGEKSSLYTAGAADVTMAAADVSNKNRFVPSGKDVVIAHNTHATDAATVTISSVADPVFGRTGDIATYSLAAGDIAVFGPFRREGWQQSGYIYLEASAADIYFGVLALP